MNIEQLRNLVSLRQTGSITKSAQRLFVTPQGISKSIKTLERELDAALVEKKNGGISLTEIGEHVCEDASRILSIVDEIPLKIRSFSEGSSLPKEIKLGISRFDLRGSTLTSQELEQLSAAIPSTITPYFSSPEGCFLAVRRSSIDAALVFGTYDFAGVSSIPLGYSQIHVAITEASPLFTKKQLELADIGGEPFLCPLDINYFYPKLLNLCSLKHISPPGFLHQTIELDMEKGFLGDGGALFVDSTSNITELVSGCKIIPLLSEPELSIPLSLIYKTDAEMPWRHELTRHLRACLHSRLPKSIAGDEQLFA